MSQKCITSLRFIWIRFEFRVSWFRIRFIWYDQKPQAGMKNLKAPITWELMAFVLRITANYLCMSISYPTKECTLQRHTKLIDADKIGDKVVSFTAIYRCFACGNCISSVAWCSVIHDEDFSPLFFLWLRASMLEFVAKWSQISPEDMDFRRFRTEIKCAYFSPKTASLYKC